MTIDIIRAYYNNMPHTRINSTYGDVTRFDRCAGCSRTERLPVCLSALCYAAFDNDIKDRAVDVSVNDIYINSSFQMFVAMEVYTVI